MRLRGTCEWLRGRRETAERWWQRSAQAAESLRAPFDAALTYAEQGRRLGRVDRLQQALAHFERIGAALEADRVRGILEGFRPRPAR